MKAASSQLSRESPRQAPSRKEAFPRSFGPYVLLKPLARGGMGALYLALSGERSMEKLCVIKTVLNHLADRSYMQRFRDEAKVVVRLSHGNLVTVFDAGQVAGEIYLAMDFIEGKDLRAVWNQCAQKGIAFPVDVAVHIAKELTRGLGYAHAFAGLSLVHRDVSPPNVLLSYSGEVKLTDFGLASSTLKLEKTAPGVIYGKVSYMAPEQARGEALDGRVDLYAAGIMLWELLTGRQLFPSTPKGERAGGEDDLLERVRNPTIVPPSAKTKRVPPALDRIVLKALNPDPEQRYQSGEAFRADLAAFQAKTAPATDVDHVSRFLHRLFGDHIDKEAGMRERLREQGSLLLPKPGTPLPDPSHSFLVAVGPSNADNAAQEPKNKPPNTDKPRDTHPDDKGPVRSGDTHVMVAHQQDAEVASASQAVGSVLGGRYRINALIGEGGMGRVYEAEHIEIGKTVAVKVLHPVYTRTPEVVARFKREARAASRIEHANVVNVTDSGTTEDGLFFFVMEFIQGIELGLAIHKAGPLPIRRALAIADQICRALQAAHDASVIHRDLKPENVLLVTVDGRPDVVKVLDFGIAKSAEAEVEDNSQADGRRLTRPGVAMGTPEYMAPEQAAGKQAEPRSDIYAVGSILYEMLSGDPPYVGDNVMEILHKKATESPRPLCETCPDIPARVDDLVTRAMARKPQDRPSSMAEMASEIESIVAELKHPGASSSAAETVEALMQGRRWMHAAQAATADALRVVKRVAPTKRFKFAATAALALLTAVALMMIGGAEAQKDVRDAGQSDVGIKGGVDNSRSDTGGAEPGAGNGSQLGSGLMPAQPDDSQLAVSQVSDPRAFDERTQDSPGVSGGSDPAQALLSGIADAQQSLSEEFSSSGSLSAGNSPDPALGQDPASAATEPAASDVSAQQVAEQPSGGADARPSDRVEVTAAQRQSRQRRLALGRRLLQDGRDLIEMQKYAEAQKRFKRLLKEPPLRGAALVGLGQIAFQQKNYKKAVRHGRQAMVRGGGVAARVLAGDAHFRLGEYRAARDAYAAALKLNPKHIAARRNMEIAERRMH